MLTMEEEQETSSMRTSVYYKQIFQCRHMWFFIFVFLGSNLAFQMKVISSGAEGLRFDFLPGMTLLFGVGSGWLLADLWGKPLSFCLPNYRRYSRKLLRMLWLVVLIVHGPYLCYLFSRGAEAGNLLLVPAMAAIVSLAFWVGVSLSTTKTIRPGGFLFFAGFIATILSQTTLNALLSNHPAGVTIIGGILSYLLYSRATCPETIRRICGDPRFGFSSLLKNRQPQPPHSVGKSKLKSERFARPAAPWSKGTLPIRRCTYLYIRPFINHWRLILFVLLFWSMLAGFIHPHNHTNGRIDEEGFSFFLIFGLFLWVWLFDPKSDHLFLLTSRRHLFWKRLSGSVTTVSIALLCFGAFIAITQILGQFPPATVMKKTFEVEPVSWATLFIPFIFWPLFEGITILRKKKFTSRYMLIVLTGLLALVPGIVIDIFMRYQRGESSFATLAITAVAITVIAWGFDIAALYCDSHRRSLC